MNVLWPPPSPGAATGDQWTQARPLEPEAAAGPAAQAATARD
jgi:hypothetical protein